MRYSNNDPSWVGKKFGRLTVIVFRKVKSGENTSWRWDCKCECGNIVTGLKPSSVRSGSTKSCGCLKMEQNSKNLWEKRRKHGKTDTRIYGIWSHMRSRCKNANNKAYKNYGGRGICVCEEWENDFENFYNWAINNGYSENLTIERKDVNKGYSPDNCCWISLSDQAKNKRNIRYVELDGEKIPLKEACDRIGLPYKAIHLRITRYGMDFETAISKPIKDKQNTLAQRSRDAGIPYHTVVARIKSGWSEEKALSEPVRNHK